MLEIRKNFFVLNDSINKQYVGDERPVFVTNQVVIRGGEEVEESSEEVG